MTKSEIAATLLKLFDEQSLSAIPRVQLQDMASLVQAGEPGVALENFCTQLFEYDVSVAPEVIGRLATLGREMGIDERHWRNLSHNAGVSPDKT